MILKVTKMREGRGRTEEFVPALFEVLKGEEKTHEVTGKWLYYQSPCSVMGLLGQLFQNPSPLEIQVPLRGLHPDSKRRDQRVTYIPLARVPCLYSYYLQENHGGKLKTFTSSQSKSDLFYFR